MKKLSLILLLAGAIYLPACSGENTSTATESESAEATANDSSTTNPINSEYGTPNASENPTDSAQSANENNNQQ